MVLSLEDMSSLLSMDVYQRANENFPAPEGANVVLQRFGLDGFGAVAYEVNGDIIIAYQGTNAPVFVDAIFGWPLANGVIDGGLASQVTDAFQFFNDVSTLYPSAEISVTGHSLGGGLAGVVGAVKGVTAYVFDHMSFSAAAANIYEAASNADLLDENGHSVYPSGEHWLELAYGGGTTTAPDYSHLHAAYVQGEVAYFIREVTEDLASPVEIPLDEEVVLLGGAFPEANARHSMALLNILKYAGNHTGSYWTGALEAALPHMWDDSVAEGLGYLSDASGGASDKLQARIAYSINPDGGVAGNQAVSSLYANLELLGLAGADGLIVGVGARGVGAAVVAYSALQGLYGVESSTPSASFITQNDLSLELDFSGATWTFGTSGDKSQQAWEVFFDKLADENKNESASAELSSAIKNLRGIELDHATLSFDIAAGEVPESDHQSSIYIAGGLGGSISIGDSGAIVVGGIGANVGITVAGGDGDDIIIGTNQHDVISAGLGINTVYGGGGADEIDATGASDTIVFGGSGSDTIRFGDEDGGEYSSGILFGGSGADKFILDAGSNTMELIYISGLEGEDTPDIDFAKLREIVSTDAMYIVVNAEESDELYIGENKIVGGDYTQTAESISVGYVIYDSVPSGTYVTIDGITLPSFVPTHRIDYEITDKEFARVDDTYLYTGTGGDRATLEIHNLVDLHDEAPNSVLTISGIVEGIFGTDLSGNGPDGTHDDLSVWYRVQPDEWTGGYYERSREGYSWIYHPEYGVGTYAFEEVSHEEWGESIDSEFFTSQYKKWVSLSDILEKSGGDGPSTSGPNVNDTAGDDILYGTAGGEDITTTAGEDTVYGNAGDDRIADAGGVSDDFFDGGAGTDGISFNLALNTVAVDLERQRASGGETGKDTLVSIENAITGAGDDVVLGSTANNRIDGGAGLDFLTGESGDDTLIGGSGADVLDGGEGFDIASYITAEDAIYIHSGSTIGANTGDAAGDVLTGIEGVQGTEFADEVILDEDGMTVWGAGGNDNITLFGLNTFAFGDGGNDSIYGGAGSDSLQGGGDDDHLVGNDGDDILTGDSGADILNGGDGLDTASYETATGAIYFHAGSMQDNIGDAAGDILNSIEIIRGSGFNDEIHVLDDNAQVLGGLGNDTIYGSGNVNVFYGEDGDDALWGDYGNDQLNGGSGNDFLFGYTGDDLLIGGAGADEIYGGDGIDTVSYETATDGIYLHSGAMQNNTGDAAGDVLDSIEVLIGTGLNDEIHITPDNAQVYGNAGNDKIYGSGNANVFYGGDGNDELWGDYGNDRLDGGIGNDFLFGYTGDDVLTGGAGDDDLYGGAGNDSFVFNLGDGVDAINDFAVHAGAASGDVIELHDQSAATFAALMLDATESAGTSYIHLDEGHSIVLQGVTLSELSATDFRFV